MFRSVRAAADVTSEVCDVAELKGGQTDAGRRVLTGGRNGAGYAAVKRELAGAMDGAWNAQVLRKTKVGSELEIMFTNRLAQVVDKLIVRLGLSERAVAPIYAERVAEPSRSYR